jgi:hypothetical protein
MENELSDQDILGDFLESAGVPVEATTPDVSTPEPAPIDLNRDPDTGRFAPKSGEEPATATTIAPTPEVAPPATPEPKANPTVPLDALTAIRAENRELKQMLQEMRQQIIAPPPKPQEQPKPASFWDDPEGFLEQKLQQVAPRDDGTVRQVSEMLAVQEYGQETVDTAGQAMLDVVQKDPNNPVIRGEYQRIMSSRHPYKELVAWHKRHQTMSRIGDNPDAYVESEIEKRLADPQYQAKVLERIRGAASTQQPITQVPPSLGRIPTGGNVSLEGPTDDAGIFAYATKGMR